MLEDVPPPLVEEEMIAPFGPVTVVVTVPSALRTTLVVSAELLELRLLRSEATLEDDWLEDDWLALLDGLGLLPVT